jgi:hypothetical protein
MTSDTGFAPNPYYGYCTLAACTPNHRPYRIDPGDWILGTTTADEGNKLIYAMCVSEVMDHDAYFNDARFENKKPKMNRSRHGRCGDNIYHRDSRGNWVSEACVHHLGDAALDRDTRYSRVYIADMFYYFGENMIDIPGFLRFVLHSTQGLKYVRDADQVQQFIAWLMANYRAGRRGSPRHQEESVRDTAGAAIKEEHEPQPVW